MSNLTVNQRNQYERASLNESSLRPRSKSGQRAAGAYVGVGLILLAVLTFAASQVFDGWPSAIVLADIVLVVLGLAAWIYPQRANI
jgi:hypothetical protein